MSSSLRRRVFLCAAVPEIRSYPGPDVHARGWYHVRVALHPDTKCATCEAPFWPKRDHQRFCSATCRVWTYRQSPEYRARAAERGRNSRSNPEQQARRRALRESPEAKAKERERGRTRRGKLQISRSERLDRRVLLYAEQDGECALCENHIRFQDMQLDHHVPLAHGGEDTVGNLRNLLCRSCNAAKGASYFLDDAPYGDQPPARPA